jgi:hypothetical protein
MPEHALDLAIYVFHLIGQQPGQTEVLAFLVGEGSALVERRIFQQRHAFRIILFLWCLVVHIDTPCVV